MAKCTPRIKIKDPSGKTWTTREIAEKYGLTAGSAHHRVNKYRESKMTWEQVTAPVNTGQRRHRGKGSVKKYREEKGIIADIDYNHAGDGEWSKGRELRERVSEVAGL
jgi:hypothetical protein